MEEQGGLIVRQNGTISLAMSRGVQSHGMPPSRTISTMLGHSLSYAGAPLL